MEKEYSKERPSYLLNKNDDQIWELYSEFLKNSTEGEFGSYANDLKRNIEIFKEKNYKFESFTIDENVLKKSAYEYHLWHQEILKNKNEIAKILGIQEPKNIPARFGKYATFIQNITEKHNYSYTKKSGKNNLISILEKYILDKHKQIILTGAPGTGKTYCTKKYAMEAVGQGNEENVKFVQFHPSYDYSDFVEGLRPVIDSGSKKMTFVRMDGIFKAFCRKVVIENYNNWGGNQSYLCDSYYNDFIKEYIKLEQQNKVQVEEKYQNEEELKENEEKTIDNNINNIDSINEQDDDKINENNCENKGDDSSKITNNFNNKKYFFIIDEINRADLSKVFGELMYCLEDSYRGLKDKTNLINTQYSNLPTYNVNVQGEAEKLKFDCFKDGFFIPENIYIIGTMNDIDRSVEAFDFALRRRFKWVEIKANNVFLDAAHEMFGKLKYSEIDIIDLSNRVEKMNQVISKEDNIFMLSEAYHIGHSYFKSFDGSKKSLEEIFNTNIISILKEYTRGRNSSLVEMELIKPCRAALLGDENNVNE